MHYEKQKPGCILFKYNYYTGTMYKIIHTGNRCYPAQALACSSTLYYNIQSNSEAKKTLLKFSHSQVTSFMVSVTCCGQTQ